MKSCREVSERLSAGLDQELPLGERITLRMHMLMCKYCARYYDQIKTLRTLASDVADQQAQAQASAPRPSADERLSSEARGRIEHAMEQALQAPRHKDDECSD